MDKGGSGVTTGIGALCPGGGDREEGRCACGRPLDMVEVHVTPTTGGQFQLRVAASDSVEYLRRLVSKRLRVPKERICLLYRDRHLRAGTLEENYIVDGARITLLPSVETGLLTQRPEQSVMQALESLNDGQVNDFLTGKAPLNLTMRLGDHMMLIQLQLSTVSPTSSRRSSSRLSSTSSGSSSQHHHSHHNHHHYHTHSVPCGGVAQGSSVSFSPSYGSSHSSDSSPPPSPSSLHRHHMSSPQSFLTTPPHHLHYHHHHHHHQPQQHNHNRSSASTSSLSSPISSPHTSPCSASPTPSCLSLDADLPVRGCPHQTGNTDPKASLDTKALAEASRNLTQTLKQLSSEVLTTKPSEKEGTRPPPTPELRKSPERPPPSSASKATKRQGAIIESMHHHGKGVYSGTFSGTLNPALQDRQGRPKRDISTIIHILNDLLCATPQYRRHSATTSASTSASGSAQNGVLSNHNKQSTSSGSTSDMFGLSSRIDATSEEDSSVDDNQVTRTKFEHLRFIMEQRRARRKARREARASPYASHPSSATTSWSSETTTLVASKASTSSTIDGSGPSIDVDDSEKDGSDSTTLCELNTGTVVA